MTKIFIPTLFLEFTGNKKIIEMGGTTAGEILDNLTHAYHPLRKFIFSDYGRINSFINIYLNDVDIKYLNDENTIINEKDVISIIPTISGGSD